MFNKFKNRNQFNQYPNYPNPYMDNPMYNQYDLSRIDEQINELKRINAEILRRINRLENYLGIRTESEASNYK